MDAAQSCKPSTPSRENLRSFANSSWKCKGLEGLLEEGEEMIRESKDKESVARDLALIAAAQKIEHYEISAYGTAREMAQQLGQPEVAQLLSRSLAEEENADSVLTTCARPLMFEAKLAEIGS